MALLTYSDVRMCSYNGSTWDADNGGFFPTQGTWQDIDIDGDYVVLGETTNYYNGIVAQARVFRKLRGHGI